MNKTLYNLVKNRDIIFIIGPMGSGKTIMANQINTADYECGGRGYEIIDDIGTLTRSLEPIIVFQRHRNRRYIVTIHGALSKKYDFNNNISVAWIFVGVNGHTYNHNYRRYVERSLLHKLAKKYYSTLKNKRKTRPYLLVQNEQLRDNVHFGRFKNQ